MATLQEQITEAVADYKADRDIMHQIVHGDFTTVVSTEGGNVKSIAKAIKDIEDTYAANSVVSAAQQRVDDAYNWGNRAEDSQYTDGDARIGYSSYHWAQKAAESASIIPLNKYNATVDPTLNDDANAGYMPGSNWLNVSTEEAYKCIDSTVGAAVWVTTTLTLDDLGTAAAQNVGTAIGNVLQLVNTEGGAGLPSIDGSNLTGIEIAANYSLFQKADIFTPAFKKTGAQTVSIKAGTRISAGGTVHYWATDTAVTMPTHSAGTDYSIWLKTDGTLEAVADSFGSPATTGDLTAPQAGAVKVGGYHYGLVGPTETVAGGSFSTSGVTSAGGSFGWTQTDVDKIKGINEFSIWDDTFKCAGEQRGMAFDPIMKMWAAIYFMSDNPDTNGPSAYNTNVGSGTVLPYIPSAWGGDGVLKYSRLATFEANELVTAFGLRLPRYEEFMAFAFGVTEGQSLGGASSTITTTARQAGYTSRIGIEQATGHQYAIGGPIHSVSGSDWSGVGRGSIYAGGGQTLLGGSRDAGSYSGSRCAAFNSALSYSNWIISVRAAGDHLNLGQAAR